ncbi:MAG: electron transport complex subunit RsxC [Clostridia bacterium]
MKKLTHPFKTHGGAHVPHHKNTGHLESVFMPIPQTVVIPMSQHIGAPCKPVVKRGDHVYVGQVVGETTGFVCAPVHASISGKVKEIKQIMLTGGQMIDSVVIESDGLMEMHPDIKAPAEVKTKADLAKIALDSGLVGLGGAGFPAHVKLNIPEGRKIDTLVINAAECEPYVTCDHREALENGKNVMKGICEVKKILDIDRVVIGVEDNKPDAIAELSRLAEETGDSSIEVMSLHAMYPQGAEKILIQAATGRCVETGKLPSDVGCVVMNIGSVSFLDSYMENGIPLIKKRITVDGSAIKNPMNVIVPVGTLIKDVVEFTGGYKSEPKKIIMGGPMMGVAITSDEIPVIKQNNGILCFDEKEAKLDEPSDCIRCGKCVQACPMSLIPTNLEKYSILGKARELIDLDIMTCMECGCCSFTCPAGRRIVQSIRLGKSVVRKAGAK